jgi:aryl-alcohol dehydrogenase-like predicted oxidoreductase
LFFIAFIGFALTMNTAAKHNTNSYTPLQAIEIDVIPFCQANNIGVIAYSPLLQGLLTNKSVALDSLASVRSLRVN